MAAKRRKETPEQREARLIERREYNARYRADAHRRERARERSAVWRSDPDNREAAARRRADPENKARVGATHRRRRYGLTDEAHTEMLRAQDFRCDICGSEDNGRRDTPHFAVDHCHATGRVRGLLCHACNRGLGDFLDDPMRLASAIAYINRHTRREQEG